MIKIPHSSDKQRKFFHTKAAKEAGITAKDAKKYDKESKGKKLPEKVKKKKK